MKLLGILLTLGIEPIARLASAQVTGGGGQPSAVRADMSRFAERGMRTVGISAVRAIEPGDEKVAEDLIEELETDGRVTGETACPPRPCRARKWGLQPTKTSGGSNRHQQKSGTAVCEELGVLSQIRTCQNVSLHNSCAE